MCFIFRFYYSLETVEFTFPQCDAWNREKAKIPTKFWGELKRDKMSEIDKERQSSFLKVDPRYINSFYNVYNHLTLNKCIQKYICFAKLMHTIFVTFMKRRIPKIAHTHAHVYIKLM